MMPKISIITAVYNNAETIAQTIKSVLGQEYPHIEYLIVDGGSTDGTVDIIRQYDKHITKWISEPDTGIYDAMNKGIQLATGEIIGLLNSDDLYQSTNTLCKVAAVFEEQKLDALYGDLVYVDSLDTHKIIRYWKSNNYKKNAFLQGWMPPHPTFFLKRNIYEQYGLFDTRLRSAADYELMLRLIHKHCIQLAYLPEILVKMRTGGVSNQSLANRLAANREDYLAWKLNGLTPRFYTLLLKPLRKLGQYWAKPPSRFLLANRLEIDKKTAILPE